MSVCVPVVVVMSPLPAWKIMKPMMDAIFTGLFIQDRRNSWVFDLRIKTE